MRKRCLLFLFFFNLSVSIFSQNIFKPEYFEGSFNTGYAVKNHPQFPDINNASITGIFRINSKLNGSKPWHQYYHYPDLGFSIIYGTIGNRNVLGNIAALLPEMAFYQQLSKRLRLRETIGFGISYFNKPFNQVSNPENIVIGSHVTFCAAGAVGIEYPLNDNLKLELNASVYHSSNSHFALPNVGLNLPLIGAGIKFRLRPEQNAVKKDSTFIFDRSVHFNIRGGIGENEQGGSTGPANGPKYPIYLASFFITKNISPVNKLQLGFEGWYNTGVYDYITSQDFYERNQKMRSTVIVFFAGHEFLIGHFSLVTQGGVNIYNPFYRDKLKNEKDQSFREKLKTIFPARIGYQYYLFDPASPTHHQNLFVGIYIKTNFGQADFLDTGIGYTF